MSYLLFRLAVCRLPLLPFYESGRRFSLNVDKSAVERGIIAEADPKCRFFRRHTLLQPFCGKRHAFGVDIMQNRHSRMNTEQAAKLVVADDRKTASAVCGA